MNLLLTSSGVKNKTIENALVDLLGKPISESKALLIPTAIYPFNGGPYYAWDAICGRHSSSLAQLGWKSVGLLELTALPGIDKKAWTPTIQEADALLFWGGDPVYLSYWMRQSGLAALFPTLHKTVYVGVSAGSMAATSTFGETFREPPAGINDAGKSEEIVFQNTEGEFKRTLITAEGAGLVDFALIPHYNNPDHADASSTNAAIWAAKLNVPVYAIDDNTAIKVKDDIPEVVSEGQWKLFNHD